MKLAARRLSPGKYFLVLLLLLVLSALTALLLSRPIDAAVVGWQPGRIIDDAIFTNKSTMNTSQIQTFLNGKVPTCDTSGQQLSEFGGPDLNNDGRVQRWEWGKANYNQTTFICLKNYKENNKSAAQIIYEASQEFSINPRVILVLLQKEQALVKDTWPLNIQYRSATGYGCPDTAACDSEYYGFTNQVRWAARMFRAIMDNSPTWYTPYVLGNNYIRYNPDSSCGGSTVYIQNRATQALYNYTPYQPNEAALDAGWGTAHCGAYGNRNFYLYYKEWFGSPLVKFVSMQTPRYMRLKEDLQKEIPGTRELIDDVLLAGRDIYFTTKVEINGITYLRTQHDTDEDYGKGIPLDKLEDISLAYEPMQTPRWMMTRKELRKVDPITQKRDSYVIPAGTKIFFPDKVIFGGGSYLRTQRDANSDTQLFIPWGDLEDTTLPIDGSNYTWVQATKDTYFKNLKDFSNSGSLIKAGQYINFSNTLTLNGVRYIQSSSPSDIGLPIESVKNIQLSFTPMKTPRHLILSGSATKMYPTTKDVGDQEFPAYTDMEFTSKIVFNGQQYLRTKHDSINNVSLVIPFSKLAELGADATPLSFVPMTQPRKLTVPTDTYKKNPAQSLDPGVLVSGGTEVEFSTKVEVDGEWYLRSREDSSKGLSYAIPLSLLND